MLLLGGEEGYKQARSVLSERFGTPHIISRILIDGLNGGKVVCTAQGVQQLADDIVLAEVALTKLDMLSEIINQRSILEFFCRFSECIKNRWRKRALETKQKDKIYPDLKKFFGIC